MGCGGSTDAGGLVGSLQESSPLPAEEIESAPSPVRDTEPVSSPDEEEKIAPSIVDDINAEDPKPAPSPVEHAEPAFLLVESSEPAQMPGQSGQLLRPGHRVLRNLTRSSRREVESFAEGSIVVPTLSDSTKNYMQNVKEFLACKNKVEEISAVALVDNAMDQHQSFERAELMHQENAQGQRATTLDEVLHVATLAKPIFDALVREIASSTGLQPDEDVLLNTEKLPLDPKNNVFYKVLTVAPLKGRARALEKIEDDYGDDPSRLTDAVRCTMVVYEEAHLKIVAEALASGEDAHQIARLKNRFAHPNFNGYRDAMFGIALQVPLLEGGGTVRHVCEIQLHLACILQYKEANHANYEFFRSYFRGNVVAAKEKMEMLERLGNIGDDINEFVRTLLAGDNETTLISLADLLDLMGERNGVVAIRTRLLQLVIRDELRQKDLNSATEALAVALQNVGQLQSAERLLEEVLGRLENEEGGDDLHMLVLKLQYANLLKSEGKFVAAEPLLRSIVSMRRTSLGNEHADTLTSISNLADLLKAEGNVTEALALASEAFEGRKATLGPHHVDTITSINSYAMLLQAAGKSVEAVPLLKLAINECREQLGSKHPKTLTLLGNLAMLMTSLGSYQEAEALFRETIAVQKELLGLRNPATLNTMNNLAFLLKSDNKLEESEVLYKEVLAVEIEVLGEQHPSVIVARSNIGMLLKTLNRFDEAEVQYRVALENATAALGRSSLTTIATINNLASVLFMVSKLAESEALLREVVVLQTERAGIDSTETLKAKRNLEEVIEYAKTKAVEEEGPKIDLPTIMGKIQQSMEMRAKGFPQGAEPLMQESLQGLRDIVGSKHEHTIKFAADLASVLKDLGKYAEAKILLTEVCASAQETLGPDHASTTEYMEALQTLEQRVTPPS